MRLFGILAMIACSSVFLAACSGTGTLVDRRLDPGTGVTVRWARKPIVLYRDNSSYGAYARNFVSMGPVEINRMGTYSYYLWFGVWNTVRDNDRRSGSRDGFESVVLFVDGTPYSLDLAGSTPDAIGVSEPLYVPPVAGAAEAYYPVTLDQIRMISIARDLELRAGPGGSGIYLPWDGSNAAEETFAPFRLPGMN